jgi:hypothetical protein
MIPALLVRRASRPLHSALGFARALMTLALLHLSQTVAHSLGPYPAGPIRHLAFIDASLSGSADLARGVTGDTVPFFIDPSRNELPNGLRHLAENWSRSTSSRTGPLAHCESAIRSSTASRWINSTGRWRYRRLAGRGQRKHGSPDTVGSID